MNLFRNFLVFVGLLCPTMLLAQKSEKRTMIYQETVCPPQWISYENDKQTLANLRELLAGDSVIVYSLKITGKPYEMTCAGCQCLTGRNFEITIDPKHQANLEENHFHRPWVWMEKNEFVCDWTMDLNEDEISDSLTNKGIRVQGLYCTGLSQRNYDCSRQSGRTLTLRVNKDDMDKARKEGFIVNDRFKEY